VKKKPCVHWWILEDVKAPTSWGSCRLCNAKKEFPNYFYDLKTTWGAQVRVSWQAPAPISFSDFNPRIINNRLPIRLSSMRERD